MTAAGDRRLGAAVRALASDVPDGYLRAQLHALAALVEQPEAATRVPGDEPAALARAIEDGMRDGDEAAVLAAARRLGRAERAAVGGEVDWVAISGG